MIRVAALYASFCLALSPSAMAGPADVLMATVERYGDDIYLFNVTVSHADEGWDHYADRWELVNDEGEVLATRTLAHPHVEEQPFTRALNNVAIPEADEVIVRAHDSKDGYGGVELRLRLTGARRCVTAFEDGLIPPDRAPASGPVQCPQRFQDR